MRSAWSVAGCGEDGSQGGSLGQRPGGSARLGKPTAKQGQHPDQLNQVLEDEQSFEQESSPACTASLSSDNKGGDPSPAWRPPPTSKLCSSACVLCLDTLVHRQRLSRAQRRLPDNPAGALPTRRVAVFPMGRTPSRATSPTPFTAESTRTDSTTALWPCPWKRCRRCGLAGSLTSRSAI